MAYRVQHVIEYGVLRFFAFVVQALPYRVALFFGWLHAWPAHFVFRFRTAEAQRRIRLVLGDGVSRREAARIAWISWRNTVFNAVDAIRMGRVSRAWMERMSDHAEAAAILQEHARSGRGAVIAVPHMGSWELTAVFCRLYAFPVFSIAAQQKNPLVDGYLNRLRGAPGDTIARGAGTLKQILRRLEKGGFLAILPDVRMRTEGLPVAFLGGTANLGKGMASFARHANVPIFPCIVTRRGWAHHAVRMREPVVPEPTLEKEADIRRMTELVVRYIDEAIRREPEQWFWYNKRWVLDPL